jgi:hypothetical protein
MRKVMAAAAATIALASMQASAAEVKIDDLIVAKTISDAQLDTELKAAEGFYQLWNTGDESLLKAVVSPNFTDHTLQAGVRRVRRARPSRRNIFAQRRRT